jgi:hypothetical protein
LPAATVPPGGFVIVAASADFDLAFPLFSGPVVYLGGSIGNGLAGAGDRLFLRDPLGRTVDALSYGEDRSVLDPAIPPSALGHSLERRTPGRTGGGGRDFADNPAPTPGGPWTAPHPLFAPIAARAGR